MPVTAIFSASAFPWSHGAVRAIRLETHSVADDDRRQVEIAEFSLAVVESSHGAVLDGVPGDDAIVLQGHFPTPPGRAALTISYLYNGFTGDYRSCPMTLDQARDAGWRLVNRTSWSGPGGFPWSACLGLPTSKAPAPSSTAKRSDGR
jgi:hypothetical protein